MEHIRAWFRLRSGLVKALIGFTLVFAGGATTSNWRFLECIAGGVILGLLAHQADDRRN